MLKKQFRLSKQTEIEEVKRLGKLASTPLFGLLYQPTSGSKIGWIVSKKISKKAVVRNRIRRLLAEVLRKNWKGWEERNMRGLILVKREIVDKKLKEIEEEWMKMMEKLNERQV